MLLGLPSWGGLAGSALEELRRLFETGALGKLLHMDANVSHSNFRNIDPANWRRDPRHAPAGAWTALGIHLGDMFVSLADRPVRVAARTASQIFPAMVSQMIGVGEQTGALDAMLSKIADFYEQEVDAAIANLLSLMEPAMILFLGVTIGTIVIAMYLPLFTLIGKLAGGR